MRNKFDKEVAKLTTSLAIEEKDVLVNSHREISAHTAF